MPSSKKATFFVNVKSTRLRFQYGTQNPLCKFRKTSIVFAEFPSKCDNENRSILTLWIECDVTIILDPDSTVQISESIRCFSRVFQWNKIMKSDWFWHCELNVMCLQFWNQIRVCKFRNPSSVFPVFSIQIRSWKQTNFGISNSWRMTWNICAKFQ